MSIDGIRFGARKDVAQMGCTTSSGRSLLSSCTSDDSHLLSPRERAIRELDRNGVDWRSPLNCEREPREKAAGLDQAGQEEQAEQTGPSPRSASGYEFVSTYLHGRRPGAEADIPIPDRIQARQIPGPQEMERRRQVIAKLRDHGILVSKHAAYLTGHPGAQLPSLNVQEMSGSGDFRSAPDAREMTIDEIRNVEFLTAVEIRQTLEMAARKLGMVVGESDVRAPEREWGYGWRDDDPRWSLTPHQLRKLRNRNRRSDQ